MTEHIEFGKIDTIALLFSIFIPGMGQVYMDKVKVGVPLMIIWMVLGYFTFRLFILEAFYLTAYGYVFNIPTDFGPYLWPISMIAVWLLALVHTTILIDRYRANSN